ncbi:MAG TPA: M56 family metallopeptidase [Terracidiphilus sp.]|nr:M56 family metallopeptidase [Terracidiphilus sp.]
MTLPEFLTLSWTAALINHLWQSTAVALLAWLITIALRNNAARVRYATWLFASIKFLIPFSVMTRIGAHWAKPAVNHSAHQAGHSFYFMIEEFNLPFRQAPVFALPAAQPQTTVHAFPIALGIIAAIWLCGCIVRLTKWIADWRRAAAMARCGEPVREGSEWNILRRSERRAGFLKQLPLILAACKTEPGVFGVIRPVLLWPNGLSERLNDAQIEAIMAHEVEHVRRRDNLTALIHTVVEALFWFHPLVRWMSAKMNEERERACDERVIEQNARPEAYAESILKVCAFCMEPATPCVSGVSGADLKERILRIMTRRSGVALSSAGKCALSATALLILAAPLGFGVLRGQAPASTTASPQSSVTTPLPKYEVASIKPAPAGDNKHMIMMRPDGISLGGVEVQTILQLAFGVEPDRIVSAPKWVQSNRYDFEAKVAPEDAPKVDKLKMEQRRAMLLPLLEERLNLKYHHETRELPMYVLVVAKGGPKLTESKPGEPMPFSDGHIAVAGPPSGGPGSMDGPSRMGNKGIVGEGMMMRPGAIQSHGGNIDFLTHALSGILGRTVADKTGLTGKYDFSLNWTPDTSMRNALGGPELGPPNGEAPVDESGPTLFTALEEQLGLKLESQKGSVDVIVIDHIDPPSEN